MSASRKTRKRVESRPIWPFRHAARAFDECRLIVNGEGGDRASQDVFEVDMGQEAFLHALELEVKLEFDRHALLEDVGQQSADVSLQIVVRNDGVRRAVIARGWDSIEKVPSAVSCEVEPGDYGPDSTNVAIIAVLNKELDSSRDSNRAWRRGSVLAERIFTIIHPRSASLFPVDFTDFSERGWPKDAIYRIEFMDTGLDTICSSSPDRVVKVHLNKTWPLLTRLMMPSATRSENLGPAATVLRSMLAAEILFAVGQPILLKLGTMFDSGFQSESVETGSTADAFINSLTERLELSPDQLMDLATSDGEELRVRIQDMVQLGRKFGRDSEERMLKR